MCTSVGSSVPFKSMQSRAQSSGNLGLPACRKRRRAGSFRPQPDRRSLPADQPGTRLWRAGARIPSGVELAYFLRAFRQDGLPRGESYTRTGWRRPAGNAVNAALRAFLFAGSFFRHLHPSVLTVAAVAKWTNCRSRRQHLLVYGRLRDDVCYRLKDILLRAAGVSAQQSGDCRSRAVDGD